MNLQTAIRLSLEASQYLSGLEAVRAKNLTTYGALKEGIKTAQVAWKEAEGKVKELAKSLDLETATKKQVRAFEKAVKAAAALKDEYLRVGVAAQAQKRALVENAGQVANARSNVSAAQQAQVQAAAVEQAQQRETAAVQAAKRAEAAEQERLARIVIASRTRMAQAAQDALLAERKAFAEAQAAATRYAQAQKAAADQRAAQAKADAAYRAAVLASQDRVDRFARQAAQPKVATQPTNLQAPPNAQLSAMSQQLANARNVALGIVGAQGIGDLVRIADAYTSIAARLKLVTNSTQAASQAQQALFAMSQRNGVAMGDSAELFTRIARPMRELGQSQAQMLGVTEAVGQAIRISGSNTQEASAAMNQFSQALGAGVLNGDELKSILENAPRLAQAVADGLGVPIGKLKELGEQGALSSQKVLQAIQSQIPQLRREAEQIPLTIGQSITQVQNAFQQYIGSADQASGSSRRIAAAISSLAANFGQIVEAVTVAGAALAAGFAVSRIASALAAVGSLVAVIASFPVVAAIAAAAGTALWLGMGRGATEGKAKVSSSLASMAQDLTLFGQRLDDTGRNEAITALAKKIEEAKERLKRLNLDDYVGEPGKKLKAEIETAEKAISDIGRLKEQGDRKNLTTEKASLGIDKLRVDGTNLIDKDAVNQLQSFDRLYKAFATNAKNSSGDLSTSYREVRSSLSTLLAMAKSPAEFDGVVARVQTALKGPAGRNDATLKNTLISAIESRAIAERNALDATLSGVSARLQRANALVQSITAQAQLAAELATGMDRVTAELKADIPAISADQAAAIRAQVVAVQSGASQQLAALKKLSSEKRVLIDQERIAAARVATDAEIDAAGEARRQRALLEAKRKPLEQIPEEKRSEKEVQALNEIAAEERRIAKDLATEKKRITEAVARDSENVIRRVADLERSTAQERLTILRNVQQELASKANDALNNYKTYAQKVIELDRQIVAARLDTASSVNAVKRKDMKPTEQVGSLRAEMEQLQSAARKAKDDGDRTLQQEVLGRQKGIANELANVKGDGVDPKAMAAEAIDHLERIGGESMTVLKEQRAEAQAAADQQKATFEALTAAASQLAVEIGKINAGEAIKLRAEVDMASVTSAIEAVKAAFSQETFAIKVAAKTTGPEQLGFSESPPIPGRADGGPIGGVGGPRADNQLTWLSPGEHVMTAAEVQSAGGHGAIYGLRSALRGGWIPRFADGGAVGSVVSRLSIPEMSPSAGASPLQPMNITLPGGQTFPVQAPPDVAAAFERHVRLETLKRGRI